MTLPGWAQRSIVDHLRTVVEWRRARMDEPFADRRNLQSAEGLEQLIEAVWALRDDDPRLQRLVELTFSGERFEPGQQLTWDIPRFHFHQTLSSPDTYITHMVELAEADAREQGEFGGPQIADDNPWRTDWRIFRVAPPGTTDAPGRQLGSERGAGAGLDADADTDEQDEAERRFGPQWRDA